MTYRLGVDIGGTFTDFALFNDDNGDVTFHKQLTTPRDPAESVLTGTEETLKLAGVPMSALTNLVHGTTLVTNAVIERKGAKTGMIVTKGFKDVLDIGMERRYDLFDLRLQFADPVVPRPLRREVAERLDFRGQVTEPLDTAAVLAAATDLVENHNIEALAICFLHSYINPEHEKRAAAAVREKFPALYVTASAETAPFMREFERWTTATVNAYTQPMMDRYLTRLGDELKARGFTGSLLMMSSSGGTAALDTARAYPVRLIESGPAAGVLMSAFLGTRLEKANLLAFDMGGTTAKGAFVRGSTPMKKFEAEVARVHDYKPGSGLPLRIPVIDLIEIGAGGGSIADVDERGLLRVGPRSAGAEPGPVCYGRGGTSPTLTDANLILGYLDPAFFLGGNMALDGDGAAAAAQRVGSSLSLDLVRTAWGIHDVINEDVARAFRMHASELGFDYRTCSMVAFGGSGPVHASTVARKLRIPEVIFPVGAGVLSALGLLISPLSFETLRSARVPLSTLGANMANDLLAPLEEEAMLRLKTAGVAEADVTMKRRFDMRYVGQGHEVEVEAPVGMPIADVIALLPKLFKEEYERMYALSMKAGEIEIVNWKVEAVAPRPAWTTRLPAARGESKSAIKGARRAFFATDITSGRASGDYLDCPVYDRYALSPGDEFVGPALVQERESTCVIGVGDRVRVDAEKNLIAAIAA